MRPEVLAPAGDRRSLRAALAAGADAVYFGLDDGFNARARAKNMALADLPEIVAEIHRAGARGYVTLNTLVFESELSRVEEVITGIAEAGVDALIVQDPAVCLLARQLCPELELHASTQMTISSAEGVRLAQLLGCTRVVVPRELSIKEIADLAATTDVELEVFVHGALCMAWSGQCLSSEAWGGRSANRGQCAQACRMPYDLMVDGEHKPLGSVRYLLSPRDLAGYRALPSLVESGVHTLKIEGRLKGPTYVTTAVQGVSRWLEAIADGTADTADGRKALARDVAKMTLAYSRGFGDGFFGGSDHQTLVPGRFPKSRGYLLGEVVAVSSREVEVRRPVAETPRGEGQVLHPLPALGGEEGVASGPAVAEVEPRPGLGVVFDAGDPEDRSEPGGPVFGVEPVPGGWVLRFGRPGPDLDRVRPGHQVWITSDPADARAAEKLLDAPITGRVPVDLVVSGAAGAPLMVRATAARQAVTVAGAELQEARSGGLDAALLSSKLGAFGGTPFTLGHLDASGLADGLYLPVSRLKALRRELVEALLPRLERGGAREVRPGALASLHRQEITPLPPAPARLIPLVRTPEQLDAVIAAGCTEVELDWMEMVGLGKAVKRARAAGLEVSIATVRVQKPGEEGYDRRIGKLAPDAVLVRHWGALGWFRERPEAERPMLHGDFSLNVTNSLTARHVLGLGLRTFTVAHDLDAIQLRALLAAVPPSRATVTVHHHIPTFHNEHCVYAAHLSEGRDWRTCGRPCDHHRIALRDHQGRSHPVVVDVECRNTVFNAAAQSAASLIPELVDLGVQRLRVEFVWESAEDVRRTLAAYQGLLDGRHDARAAVREVGVHEQFGVTLGTMQVL